MSRNQLFVGAALLLVVVSGVAFGLGNFVLGDTEQASGPATAIPLELEAAPAAEADAGGESEAAGDTAGATELIRFGIDQAASEARFILGEVLRGAPTTVVGATNQVAGEIAADFTDLSSARVGVIQVNARTLATDQDRRNRAIRNFVLHTDDYEFITFTPTAIVGLSGSAGPGDSFTFQIEGDLTIRDITHPVTFEATATAVSDHQLSGMASTTVLREDYGLTIPSVPFVADVDQEVRLEIEFMATAIS